MFQCEKCEGIGVYRGMACPDCLGSGISIWTHMFVWLVLIIAILYAVGELILVSAGVPGLVS